MDCAQEWPISPLDGNIWLPVQISPSGLPFSAVMIAEARPERVSTRWNKIELLGHHSKQLPQTSVDSFFNKKCGYATKILDFVKAAWSSFSEKTTNPPYLIWEDINIGRSLAGNFQAP